MYPSYELSSSEPQTDAEAMLLEADEADEVERQEQLGRRLSKAGRATLKLAEPSPEKTPPVRRSKVLKDGRPRGLTRGL
jgi:hypothetical protein